MTPKLTVATADWEVAQGGYRICSPTPSVEAATRVDSGVVPSRGLLDSCYTLPDPKALIPPIDSWFSIKLAKARALALACRPVGKIEMEHHDIKAAPDRHWAASDANDFEAEHQIYQEDAVLEYPQSGERIRGRRNIQASRSAQPSSKRFTMRH